MRGGIERAVAKRIKLVILDVDGVLTDNGVYIGATAGGESVELKKFSILDGLGIKMLQWGEVQVALVSGRQSVASRLRAEELKIECHMSPSGEKISWIVAGKSWVKCSPSAIIGVGRGNVKRLCVMRDA